MQKVVRTVHELRCAVGSWRSAGLRSAVVPTMGALHKGHVRLVEAGLARAGRVVATIFVNPKQFAPNEDLARYPRDEAGDLAMLEAAGAHLAYIPSTDTMYPGDFATTVRLGGPATAGLEDRFRPHFFDGVATVVAKLFIQCGCDYAMFGEKDYQQLRVVTHMARDLDLPIEVVGVATVREPDGLALSSRNRYLSAEERTKAPALHRALTEAVRRIRTGEEVNAAAEAAFQALTADGFRVDYVAARHAETLAEAGPGEPLRLLAAAWLGSTRLIDNVAV